MNCRYLTDSLIQENLSGQYDSNNPTTSDKCVYTCHSLLLAISCCLMISSQELNFFCMSCSHCESNTTNGYNGVHSHTVTGVVL